jgi:hypothetical protein
MISGGGQAWGLDTPLDRLAAVTLQAPWLVPYQGQLSWMIPAASITLLIPFLVASVLIEYAILKARWKTTQVRLGKAVVSANVLSYLLLAGYYTSQLALVWGRVA